MIQIQKKSNDHVNECKKSKNKIYLFFISVRINLENKPRYLLKMRGIYWSVVVFIYILNFAPQIFSFGAAITGNTSGLVFNNGMDDFSYPGRSVNYFGLRESSTNYPQPGKRALTSLSPAIVINRKTNMPKMVIGSAGGSKIISALSLAILRYICCKNSLKEVIDEPRFHHQLVPDVFEYEYGVIADIIDGLKLKGHMTQRYRHRGTIINALTFDDRNIFAISDYRKDLSGVSGY